MLWQQHNDLKMKWHSIYGSCNYKYTCNWRLCLLQCHCILSNCVNFWCLPWVLWRPCILTYGFGNYKHSSTVASSGLARSILKSFSLFSSMPRNVVMNNEVMAFSQLRFHWKGCCNPYLVLSLDIHVLHVLYLFPCKVEPLAYALFKIIHFEIDFKILRYINLLFNHLNNLLTKWTLNACLIGLYRITLVDYNSLCRS